MTREDDSKLPSSTIIDKLQIKLFTLYTLRKRLELEIKVPGFAKSRTGTLTMQAVKSRGGPRTRPAALTWINGLIQQEEEFLEIDSELEFLDPKASKNQPKDFNWIDDLTDEKE